MAKPGRPGAAKSGKGATKGSGGNNKRRLAGKGPTPKAEDRKKHKAFKLKQAEERKARALGIKTAGKGAGNSKTARELEAAKAKPTSRAAATRSTAPRGARPAAAGKSVRDGSRRGEFLAPTARTAGSAGAARRSGDRVAKAADAAEVLSGRNSVLEALRAKVPATALYIANRIEMDDRVKEAIKLAEAAAIRVEELKKATREEDLKTVKALIERHTFTQTDLKSVLKSSTGKRAYTKKSTK